MNLFIATYWSSAFRDYVPAIQASCDAELFEAAVEFLSANPECPYDEERLVWWFKSESKPRGQ